MSVSPEDYLLLMFSMKGIGKRVDLKHVQEKISRDLRKFSEEDTKKILEYLIEKGFLEEVKNQYGVTKEGKEFFAGRMKKIEEELRKINEPWVIVYKAKQYYPIVADTVFEFCKDRYVGYYCLFTEQRFFRRDFRGKKIVLRSPKDLLFFINIHYIDVIPCVHRIGINRPDWLVVDIDPGPKVDFEKTKQVARITHKIFERLDLNPALKFSGSRGFQVWSLIKEFEIPEEYQPLVLKGESKRERNYFSLFADFVRLIQREVDEEIPDLTTSETMGKEEREDKILLDSASMKPMGLVRSPYAVHSKTGLVSLPISVKELEKFEPGDATTEKTIERYKKRGNEFILKESDPSKLLNLFEFS
jgi:DNA primase